LSGKQTRRERGKGEYFIVKGGELANSTLERRSSSLSLPPSLTLSDSGRSRLNAHCQLQNRSHSTPRPPFGFRCGNKQAGSYVCNFCNFGTSAYILLRTSRLASKPRRTKPAFMHTYIHDACRLRTLGIYSYYIYIYVHVWFLWALLYELCCLPTQFQVIGMGIVRAAVWGCVTSTATARFVCRFGSLYTDMHRAVWWPFKLVSYHNHVILEKHLGFPSLHWNDFNQYRI